MILLDFEVVVVGTTGVIAVTVAVAVTEEYVVGSEAFRFVKTADAKSIDFKLLANVSAFDELSITILD